MSLNAFGMSESAYRGDRDPDIPYDAAARHKRNAERMTAVCASHPATGAPVITLTRECHATIAKAAGARYGPVLGGQEGGEDGWRRLGYLFKEPPKPPDYDFFLGGKRPFDEAQEDAKADSEASMRQLRDDCLEMQAAERIAKDSRRHEAWLRDKVNAFETRHRRPWRYIAESYFPDEFREDEAEDEDNA